MKFWDTLTGSDLTREFKSFEARADMLPAEYRAAWEQIVVNLLPHSGFTGRDAMPILDGILGFLEETASEGQKVREAVGDDITGFCAAIAGERAATSYRDKWRDQLNRNVARKLDRLGG
ncbi:DUF1048 domain-containing protein [Nocardia salmonicida]|uniref:DUF1048 domain-containing protein n=1 Tax=Nocardia salmonicida TaxID=53431 RepID=UPI0007A4CDCB|nr:DUF1048 domain-containing protein [Nocardia salmonicida]